MVMMVVLVEVEEDLDKTMVEAAVQRKEKEEAKEEEACSLQGEEELRWVPLL